MTTDTTTQDPTTANELAELERMTRERPSPTAERDAEQAEEQESRNDERTELYCQKIYPFVRAYGARLKRPFAEREEIELTKALAGVGVWIIPEHGTGPSHPLLNLLVVGVFIAAPRVMEAWSERKTKAADEAAGNGEPTPPQQQPAAARSKSGDPMLDAAREIDSEGKPH